MALADLTPVFDIISRNKDRELEQKRLDQQQRQFDTQQKLAEKTLDYQHQHEEAALAAQQAFERSQLQYSYAQHPDVIRNMGGTPVNQTFAQMTNGPTNELANRGPLTETYNIPSQGLGGQQPLSFTIPGQLEEARQKATVGGIENEPLFTHEEKLKKMDNDAAEHRDLMNWIRSESKDQRDRASQESINSADFIKSIILEQMRGQNELNAARERRDANPNLEVNEKTVDQYFKDIKEGRTTVEALNKDKGLTKAERFLLDNMVKGGNVGTLTDKQKDALDAFGSVIPYIRNIDQATATLPYTESRAGAITKNIVGAHTGEFKRLSDEMQGAFGGLAKSVSSLSAGRIPIMEATKILQSAIPDTTNYSAENIAKRNDLVGKLMNHIDQTLATIPETQRHQLIEDRLQGYDTSPVLNYQDMRRHAGMSSTAQAPVIIHSKEEYDKLAPGTPYTYNGKTAIKGSSNAKK